MKINVNLQEYGILHFDFSPENSDPLQYRGVKMGNRSCEVHLPEDWKLEDVHPDVLALAAILIIYPFAGPSISLPFGVSQPFHDYFKQTTKKELEPINHELKPRKSPLYSVPALAFSGGVDSMAALMLLPRSTNLFYLERIVPKNITKKQLYNKEAALHACNTLQKEGRSVYTIKSDLEFVRDPEGFPVDVANAIPALLLSDYIGLDSIAWGTIIECTYNIGKGDFQDYKDRLHYKRWGKLFELVDLPFNQVVGGISEIGTSTIVLKSPYKSIAQSCVRGIPNKPCQNCWKCFRKELIEKTIKGDQVDETTLNRNFKYFKERFSKIPIADENIFNYITSRYNGSNSIMTILKGRTRGGLLDVSWLGKWYSPSVLILPEKYRSFVSKQIPKYIDVMTKEEEKAVESWKVEFLKNDPDILNLHEQLLQAIDRI